MTANRRLVRATHNIGPDRRDVFETPCVGSWEIFDALIDGRPDTVRFAREKAIAMCATCPIQPQCFRDNRGEAWVQVIAGQKPPTLRDWERDSVDRERVA